MSESFAWVKHKASEAYSNVAMKARMNLGAQSSTVVTAVGVVLACLCCIMCLLWYALSSLFDDEDEKLDPNVFAKAQTLRAAGEDYVISSSIASSVSASSSASKLPNIPRHPLCKLSKGNSSKPKVRWLPLRRPVAAAGGYSRTGMDEDNPLQPARYEIASGSEEEGSYGGGACSEDSYGQSYDDGRYGPALGAGDSIGITVSVPAGGEQVFRLAVPSGAQIIVPLPAGTYAGDSVDFELTPEQLAALPRSDVVALRDGRFHVEPGDGE